MKRAVHYVPAGKTWLCGPGRAERDAWLKVVDARTAAQVEGEPLPKRGPQPLRTTDVRNVSCLDCLTWLDETVRRRRRVFVGGR